MRGAGAARVVGDVEGEEEDDDSDARVGRVWGQRFLSVVLCLSSARDRFPCLVPLVVWWSVVVMAPSDGVVSRVDLWPFCFLWLWSLLMPSSGLVAALGVPYCVVSQAGLNAGEAPFCLFSLFLDEVMASFVRGFRGFLPVVALFSIEEEMLFLEPWLKVLRVGVIYLFSGPSIFVEDMLMGCPLQSSMPLFVESVGMPSPCSLGFLPLALLRWPFLLRRRKRMVLETTSLL
ncbi:hypothetical protein SUGI_0066520 [Cryptomeria japonica]|nr:hypothetical protein SUGI_0066520 [Cryptomeria japonica]